MAAALTRLEILNKRLDPAIAEIGIAAEIKGANLTTRLEGRFVGPQCRYATTVEVAYPVKVIHPAPLIGDSLAVEGKVIIPDPSLWDPISPFLYRATFEIWENERQVQVARMTHGLRRLHLGPGGMRINQSQFPIRGTWVRNPIFEEDLKALHSAGHNTLVAKASAAISSLWDQADQWGFLIIMAVDVEAELEAALAQADAFRSHACCLGWLIHGRLLKVNGMVERCQRLLDATQARDHFLGLQCDSAIRERLPAGFAFVVGEVDALEGADDVAIAKIQSRNDKATPGTGLAGFIDL